MKEFNLSDESNPFGELNEFYWDKDVKEFIKINSTISEEEGKSEVCKDTFQEGFEFAVNRLKRTSGDKLV